MYFPACFSELYPRITLSFISLSIFSQLPIASQLPKTLHSSEDPISPPPTTIAVGVVLQKKQNLILELTLRVSFRLLILPRDGICMTRLCMKNLDTNSPLNNPLLLPCYFSLFQFLLLEPTLSESVISPTDSLLFVSRRINWCFH